MAALNDFHVDLENGLGDDPDDEISSLKDEGGRPPFFSLGMVSIVLGREAGADGDAYFEKRSLTELSNSSKRSFGGRPIRLIKRRM